MTQQPERGLRDFRETAEEKEIQRGRYAGHVSPVEERAETVAGEDAEPQHETEQRQESSSVVDGAEREISKICPEVSQLTCTD